MNRKARKNTINVLVVIIGWAVLSVVPPAAVAATKIAVLTTDFVMERKFTLMKDAAEQEQVEFASVPVNRAAPDAVRRTLDDAALVIVDAPRQEDQAAIDKAVGSRLREQKVPTLFVMVMSPPRRMLGLGLDADAARALFAYYTNGTPLNYGRMFQFIKRNVLKLEPGEALPPVELPPIGIYHPRGDRIFPTLPMYLDWARPGLGHPKPPVVGVEISSSFIADGQTRMLEDMVARIEQAGGLPVLFYRNPRGGRTGDSAGGPPREPGPPSAERSPSSVAASPQGQVQPLPEQFGVGSGFPSSRPVPIAEFLVADGKLFPDVLINATFLGSDPEARKAEHEALGIPVIQTLSYREGDRAAYLKDKAGVSSFFLPFQLTTPEYIGLMDSMLIHANEQGEWVPIPEQADAVIGKAVNLIRLQRKPNAEKKIALLTWNHPPGDTNQSASHLNVPRSLEALAARMKEAGYRVRPFTDKEVIAALPVMQRPRYRRYALVDLAASDQAAFLPIEIYKAWFATLPEPVRREITALWGEPENSPWVIKRDGKLVFVIPRFEAENLIVIPQPLRGETATPDEKKQYHDTKIPLNHHYLAVYLWVREVFKADAIVHFGTHGTQEWTPGKERGLWMYDSPNLLVGNTPIVYPYIVDNISEAIHVKRRGRGVIVSHQTPPFAPAGLPEDVKRLNDLLHQEASLDEGLVKQQTRRELIRLAVSMHLHQDLGWKADEIETRFADFREELHEYVEDVAAQAQPLGLHTLGRVAPDDHLASTVMQMLGKPLYEAVGVSNAQEAFSGDYTGLKRTKPYRFVEQYVVGSAPLNDLTDPSLQGLAQLGRVYLQKLQTMPEVDHVLAALSGRFVGTSYGGDPIRNPDALPTGRNLYGFDPSRVPTPAAYEAGKEALNNLIAEYRQRHGAYPDKLTFSVWSTETMRHLGMLEAQILHAIGAKPVWDRGGRVIGMEVISDSELGRPRIDVVISIVGLYRDQFPNVMERLNEAIVKVAALGGADNAVRRHAETVKRALVARGISAEVAEEYALTRIFGTESGDYGTKLPEKTLDSGTWTGDEPLAKLYLNRMSWAYGPNPANWSRKLQDPAGNDINVYAEHLRGTSAAVFSRSSNLRGLLDTDHPFEYLGGISLAVRYLDGASPPMYISNMRDPKRAKLESAGKFLATELRAIYHHPRYVSEMMKEGYAGTLELLDTVNNFWGWTAVDKAVVRDDQWQAFHDIYVNDRYRLGLRQWFEQANPAALAQIAERMLEAIRKGYWQADERTTRNLVRVYRELARQHDVFSTNQAFRAYVADLANGFGISGKAPSPKRAARPSSPAAIQPPALQPPVPVQVKPPAVVRGQELREVARDRQVERVMWRYAWIVVAMILAGMAHQAWRTRRERRGAILGRES